MNLSHTSANSRLLNNFNICLSLIAACILFVTACKEDSTGTGSGSDEFNIKVVNTQSHGDVLTDGDGNVLYYFTPDVEGESVCEGTCISNWPVFNVATIKTEGGLDPANFGTISRGDGSSQTTYFGWPLYYFAGDSQPGDTNGDGIESFGGIWYVAKPNYTIVRASQQLVGHDGKNYTSDYTVGEEVTTHYTDINGRTLYIFAFDSANTNNFTAEDFSNNSVWPIFHVDIKSLPSELNRNLFGEITVHGERSQLTYKGWPLYYFGQDNERGDTKGVSFPQPGIWPVAQKGIAPAPGYNGGEDGDDDNGGPRY